MSLSNYVAGDINLVHLLKGGIINITLFLNLNQIKSFISLDVY